MRHLEAWMPQAGTAATSKDYSATPLSQKLGAKPGVDVLVFFTTSRAELERRFADLRETLAPADGLWIAWPKKAAGVETDLDFETVQGSGSTRGSSTTRAPRSTTGGKRSGS